MDYTGMKKAELLDELKVRDGEVLALTFERDLLNKTVNILETVLLGKGGDLSDEAEDEYFEGFGKGMIFSNINFKNKNDEYRK